MYFEGNVLAKVSEKLKTQRIRKETEFVYVLSHNCDKNAQNPGQVFSDYKLARKTALRIVKRKNNLLEKHSQLIKQVNVEIFIEHSPDLWSDGKEIIRISVMEIKNS